MTEKLKASELIKLQSETKPKANKYGAKKTVVDGITFDSMREAARWQELKLLERASQITDLRRQVVIELQGRDGPMLTRTGRKMKITVDFAYTDLSNEATAGLTIYEDAKGTPTRDYEVRRAAAQAQGVEIGEV